MWLMKRKIDELNVVKEDPCPTYPIDGGPNGPPLNLHNKDYTIRSKRTHLKDILPIYFFLVGDF